MSSDRRVLLVEDDASMAGLYLTYLEDGAFDVEHVKTGDAALAALRAEAPEVVLLDLVLPDMDGFEILRSVAAEQIPTSVIVITGKGSLNVAVEAMKLGARDFLVKPFGKERLRTTLSNVLETRELRRVVQTYRSDIDRHDFQGFIGSSLVMQGVYRTIESAARSKAAVFIAGESGTGKELCAEAIHRLSNHADWPFIALNCSAIPRELVESEIFGHLKGAFTGAVSDRIGAAEKASGGTLFLDEICEMELSLQPKLLRFLQSGTVQRVGSNEPRPVNVRIVSATNRDPFAEVRSGRLREDLYYRLHVLPIDLPALREREGDVIEIAERLLVQAAHEEGKRFERLTPAAEAMLASHSWPGNVRELQNVIRNAVVLHDGEELSEEMLPALVGGGQPSILADPGTAAHRDARSAPDREADEIRPMREFERDAIERAIEICDGNVPEAAVRLGISAATIYRKRAAWRR